MSLFSPEEIVDISSSFQIDSVTGTPRSSKEEETNFNLDEVEDFGLGYDDENDVKSVNFGGGLDLLMNTKFKDKKKTSGGSLSGGGGSGGGGSSDLDKLEQELNNLTADTSNFGMSSLPSATSGPSSSSNSFFSSFGLGGGGSGSGNGGGGGGGGNGGSSLGRETASSTFEDKKTWDGFGKLLGTPVNPDKPFIAPEKEMTKEEMLKEKFCLLKKIQTIEKKHKIEFSKKYNMDSSFSEMKGEYESVVEEREKMNAIKWQGNMLMMFVNGAEYLNDKFDPFDVNLEGWSDQVSDNLPDYDDIFAELHEKYKSKGKWAPELRLLFQLGGSAMMVHMSNKMFKSSLPSVDDIFKQNPDLMKQFQSAAVNSMGSTNPGFSGFMNNVMGLGGAGQGPPPPLPEEFITQSRGGNNFRGGGPSQQPTPMSMQSMAGPSPPPTMQMPSNTVSQSKRAEMKGPSDISDILSSLKTKSIQINKPNLSSSSSSSSMSGPSSNPNAKRSLSQFFSMQEEDKGKSIDFDSMSVNSTSDSINPSIPKKSKRKQNKSNSNTLSLDI